MDLAKLFGYFGGCQQIEIVTDHLVDHKTNTTSAKITSLIIKPNIYNLLK